MTSRICKYGCGIVLGAWDDNAKKFIEAGSGGLHTKERCQEAKLKLEQKNNHGNEEFIAKPMTVPQITAPVAEFKDHTAKGLSKVKIFFGLWPDVENEYNDFLAKNHGKIRTQGAHDHVTFDGEQEPLVSSIFLYYEEIKQ